MNEPTLRRLPDGREVRTIKHQLTNASVELHTSPHDGEWLWSTSVRVGTNYGGALPFPGRRHEPPAATEAEALRRATEAALKRLRVEKNPPRPLVAWLEERLAADEQPALFGAPA